MTVNVVIDINFTDLHRFSHIFINLGNFFKWQISLVLRWLHSGQTSIQAHKIHFISFSTLWTNIKWNKALIGMPVKKCANIGLYYKTKLQTMVIFHDTCKFTVGGQAWLYLHIHKEYVLKMQGNQSHCTALLKENWSTRPKNCLRLP